MQEGKPGEKVPLADLLDALGYELREAQQRQHRAKRPAILNLKECSVTLGVGWTLKGQGEIDVFVVRLGGGVDRTNTQTITVTMTPTNTFLDEGGLEFA